MIYGPRGRREAPKAEHDAAAVVLSAASTSSSTVPGVVEPLSLPRKDWRPAVNLTAENLQQYSLDASGDYPISSREQSARTTLGDGADTAVLDRARVAMAGLQMELHEKERLMASLHRKALGQDNADDVEPAILATAREQSAEQLHSSLAREWALRKRGSPQAKPTAAGSPPGKSSPQRRALSPSGRGGPLRPVSSSPPRERASSPQPQRPGPAKRPPQGASAVLRGASPDSRPSSGAAREKRRDAGPPAPAPGRAARGTAGGDAGTRSTASRGPSRPPERAQRAQRDDPRLGASTAPRSGLSPRQQPSKARSAVPPPKASAAPRASVSVRPRSGSPQPRQVAPGVRSRPAPVVKPSVPEPVEAPRSVSPSKSAVAAEQLGRIEQAVLAMATSFEHLRGHVATLETQLTMSKKEYAERLATMEQQLRAVSGARAVSPFFGKSDDDPWRDAVQ